MDHAPHPFEQSLDPRTPNCCLHCARVRDYHWHMGETAPKQAEPEQPVLCATVRLYRDEDNYTAYCDPFVSQQHHSPAAALRAVAEHIQESEVARANGE